MAQKNSANKKGSPLKDKRNGTLLDKLDNLLDRNEKITQWIILGLSLLFSFLLFNDRISEGNDDSLYIEAGYNYAHKFSHYYYTANAPFYPMFLGVLIALIGVKLFWLKLFSVLFNFLGIYFFYKAFVGRIRTTVLFVVMLTVAVNSYFLYFASQTYTEAFFFFGEGLFVFSFFSLLDKLQTTPSNQLKDTWKSWLLVGFFTFFLTMTRNVAAVVILAPLVFFALKKDWISAGLSFGAFLVFKIPFELVKSLIWGKIGNQYGSQTSLLLNKDPYNPAMGQDDWTGFLGRLVDNTNGYLSRRLFQILGFIPETFATNIGLVAILVLSLFFIGLFIAWRQKQEYMFFSGILTLFLCGATFTVLQQRWDQPRMVMIHVPIILLTIFGGLAYLFKQSSVGQNILVLVFLLIIGSSFVSTTSKVGDNLPVLARNLGGDKYFGYSPDWMNFLKMSEWCADNLPDSAVVVSRKAPMSFVYGKGKSFFAVYKVIGQDSAGNVNPDSALAYFRKNKVTHVILASLRRDPAKADGNYINTLHRMLEPIAQKYPNKIRLVCQIPGPNEPQIEPAYLYELSAN